MYTQWMPVEVFADVACPFTHIGLLRFIEERDRRGRSDVRLVVRSWPLEMVNGRPLDPAFIAEEIDEIRPQVDRDYFGGFDPATFPSSSVPAMALAAAAYAAGEGTGEEVSIELRRLLFCDGTDIADPAVLDGVARRFGVAFDAGDRAAQTAAVSADYERGRQLGVTGSPHFFTSTGDFFCPALSVGRNEDGHLVVSADEESFAEFVEACLR